MLEGKAPISFEISVCVNVWVVGTGNVTLLGVGREATSRSDQSSLELDEEKGDKGKGVGVLGASEEGKGEETSEDIDLLRNLQFPVHLFTHF